MLNRMIKNLHFYLVRLPFIYLAIPIGFIFEFLITFPYVVMCEIDRKCRQKRNRK